MSQDWIKLASMGGRARAAKLTKAQRVASARHAASFPKKARRRKPLRERFDAKWCPEPFSGCWLWTAGALSGMQYGTFGVDTGVSHLAHRVSWELHRGPIPEGLCVLHRCDTPLCVNPEHLWLGTYADNNEDMAAKGRVNRRLTPENVREIRSSGESHAALGRRFKVHPKTILRTKERRTWKHI